MPQGERIFALVGNAAIRDSRSFRDLAAAHGAFLAEYRAGNFAEARRTATAAKECAAAANWAGIYYCNRMRKRLKGIIAAGLPAMWDAVNVAEEK